MSPAKRSESMAEPSTVRAAPYFRPAHLGPDCSTPRTARLREHRFAMGYAPRTQPAEIARLADEAQAIYLRWEPVDPALARAHALLHIVQHCDIALEPDALFLGGEDPFFFNLLLPALNADRHSREREQVPTEAQRRLRDAGAYSAAYFEGHITPGLEYVLGQGIRGYRQRLGEFNKALVESHSVDQDKQRFYEAALLSCEAILLYAERYRQAAQELAASTLDPDRAEELREMASILLRVPEHPATTLREALQAYWIVYILVTLEMGGCSPGGGLGLGRLDQFLYPYYSRDIAKGRLTRAQALELMEQLLLCFRHVDYYTSHQIHTPGSQASLGGVSAYGDDAYNELTELLMEASLRISMPAPYLSVRLHRGLSEREWEAAAAYIASGLGFPVVNDEVLIPALLRHGRSLGDARDYICSCCYEHTIPGREAFHPSCCFVNLALILELALNGGYSLLTATPLGCATPPETAFTRFEDILTAFRRQLHYVFDQLVAYNNAADMIHATYRRYPMMSLFVDDCIAKGQDICAGGARYNLTGCVVGGLPNVVNALAAIQHCVFKTRSVEMRDLLVALRCNFAGYDHLRRQLLAAPKWGNGDLAVDWLATELVGEIYGELAWRRNPRGGRWQLGLYSFVANHWMGRAVGASADGRMATESLTRNLNPTWGSDRHGPTAVLRSLSSIDFTTAPDGCALDLRFSPSDLATPELRRGFAGFLKTFVDLGIMEMQITVVDTATLQEAREHPERHPHLMVRVAGYSARFVDLSPEEQDEVIGRSLQQL